MKARAAKKDGRGRPEKPRKVRNISSRPFFNNEREQIKPGEIGLFTRAQAEILVNSKRGEVINEYRRKPKLSTGGAAGDRPDPRGEERSENNTAKKEQPGAGSSRDRTSCVRDPGTDNPDTQEISP